MKNVIVIGASQGLGLALATLFLEKGHRVAAGILEQTPPGDVASLQNQYGDQLLVFPADVTKEEQVKAGAAQCLAFFGKADALCNVAGVLLEEDRNLLLHQSEIALMRTTFEVNTIGAITVIKYFYPVMKQGARFLTVTSEGVGVKQAGSWIPAYALSKMAATKISGIMNQSVTDVDFYSVHPGRMNTQMGKATAQIEPQQSAQGFYGLMTGAVPLCREDWYMDYTGHSMDA